LPAARVLALRTPWQSARAALADTTAGRARGLKMELGLQYALFEFSFFEALKIQI
jgi:hypothetical protein